MVVICVHILNISFYAREFENVDGNRWQMKLKQVSTGSKKKKMIAITRLISSDSSVKFSYTFSKVKKKLSA
jgi:hypothetical protein